MPHTPPPIPIQVSRSFAQGLESLPQPQFNPCIPSYSKPGARKSSIAHDELNIRRLIPTAPHKPFHDYTPAELSTVSTQLALIKKTEKNPVNRGELCKLEVVTQKLYRVIFSDNIKLGASQSSQPANQHNQFKSPVRNTQKKRRAKQMQDSTSPFSVYTPKRLEKTHGNSYF